MSFKIDGLDELQNQLKKMEQGAKELGEKKQLSFAELFPNSFMQKYTSFSSIDDLFTSGGFNAESQDAFEAIPESDLDKHIAATSIFKTWDDMLQTATNQYISKKLGL